MSNKKNQSSRNKTAPVKDQNRNPRFPIWIYIVLFMVLIAVNFYFVPGDSAERVKYSTFLDYVSKGYVEEILIVNGSQIEGKFSDKAVEEGVIERPVGNEDRWQFA